MESITLSFGLIPIVLFVFLCLMLFSVSDAKEKLMILGFFILVAISFCVIISDTMHDFILYLHEFGAIDLNNMIPVERSLCQLIDIKNEQDPFRKILWRNEARWIRANGKNISSKAKLLYEQYINNTLPDHVKNRCANFPRLEKLLDKYMQKQQVKKSNNNGLSIY